MVTGRNPFEHTKGDDLVVRKVLSGDRPDRPPVGFSDALWALLTRSWAEVPESSDPHSARTSIAHVLERLQDEEKSWSSAYERPLPPVPVELEASRMSPVAHDLLTCDLLGPHSGEFRRGFRISRAACREYGFVSTATFASGRALTAISRRQF